MHRAIGLGIIGIGLWAAQIGTVAAQSTAPVAQPPASFPMFCPLPPEASYVPAEACLGGCQPVMQGVDCRAGHGAEAQWSDIAPMNFQPFGQGEYAGPPRLAHLAVYRLRPGDQLQLVFLLAQRQTNGPYRLMIGDEVMLESMIAGDELKLGTYDKAARIQPDGTVTVKMLGPVHAAGLTIEQLRETLEEKYTKYYPRPAIDVLPVRTNSVAQEIRNAVAGSSSFQGQFLNVRIAPDGTLRLPELGEVRVQGMSLDEVKRELNYRYAAEGIALEVEPILAQQTDHFVFVLGEVATPNRIQLNGPTTVMGAIAAVGGWKPGANLRQVVVFRRAEDWRMVSTMLDLRGALLGKHPTPADEIWLRDADVVVIPPTPIRLFDNFVQQVFSEGIYGVVPFGGVSINVGNNNN